ncbi:redoxin domain-containing protein [bacterium]|nr:MAG: redoxin domain-containing protein [bacterium]QQR62082.1 MAG: redoxin domain-containing protein [bacterium]QQR63362.1 MAG: redoxin domain-containing protein [bacterium]
MNKLRKIVLLLQINFLCEAALLVLEQRAPQFNLIDQNGQCVALSQFVGRKVALIFHSKVSSEKDKKQIKNMAQYAKIFRRKGIVPLGLSRDLPSTHRTILQKLQVSDFTLLTTTPECLKAYDAENESWFQNTCVTVLIDEEGKVVGVITDVDHEKHAEQILKKFEEIKAHQSS